MITSSARSRQPNRPAWSLERLLQERAILLGYAIAPSTHLTYSSALESYIAFCQRQQFPINPTIDTLSFYVAYMSAYVAPSTVASYLSGICHKLEPYFPEVRHLRKNRLVAQTLQGAKRLRGRPKKKKRPITASDIRSLVDKYGSSDLHDDRLFLAQVLAGWHGLLRTSDVTQPDRLKARVTKRLMLRRTVRESVSMVSFVLPGHKADQTFQGHDIVLQKSDSYLDPMAPMLRYIRSRDAAFPFSPQLWLRADGSVPTYSWVKNRIQAFFGNDYGGSSMRSGGADYLALIGTPYDMIQAIGRWSSEAFKEYLRTHPILVQSMIWNRPLASSPPSLTLTPT